MKDSSTRNSNSTVTQQFDGIPLVAVEKIAEFFSTIALVEPYSATSQQPVYAINHSIGKVPIRIVCWPSLNRVDIRIVPYCWIAKAVTETTVIDNIEVMFRTASGTILFVSINGDVLMASS